MMDKLKPYLLILAIIIPLFFAIHLRLVGEGLPQIDSWGKSTVESNIKEKMLTELNSQYPNLPDGQKADQVNTQYNNYYKNNKATVDASITQATQYFKSTYKYADANGVPDSYVYMPDIDTYYWLRYEENYLRTGIQGDKIIDGGQQWDTHVLAPKGTRFFGKSFHVFFLAGMYNLIKPFNSGMTPMQAMTYFPMLIMIFSTLLAFLLGRRLSNSNIGGFFSALFISVITSVMARTAWGRADTDAWNIFFPLLIMWLLYEVFHARKLWAQITLSISLSLSMAVYAMSWQGWWYLFDFIIAAIILNLIIYTWKHWKIVRLFNNKEVKISAILITCLVIITMLGTFWYGGDLNIFKDIMNGPLDFINIKQASNINLWPNVLTTVAELNPGSLAMIVSQNGGWLMFLISVIGFGILLFTKNEEHNNLKYGLLMIFWFFATAYASIKGQRFILLTAPVLVIGFGVCVAWVIKKLSDNSQRWFHLKDWLMGAVLICVVLTMFIMPVRDAYSLTKTDMPFINDAWYDSLTGIKENSQPNAIVSSWWDFGHYFKYFSDRGVNFDGGSQTAPAAYWIGKVLSTNDDEQARGILRMLACGGNDAFEVINAELEYTPHSVGLLTEVVGLNKSDAVNKLVEHGFTTTRANTIWGYMHCDNPPEVFLVTSTDMVGKSGVWSHFGSWNFYKADMWVNKNQHPDGLDPELAVQYWNEMQGISTEDQANNWISGWYGYAPVGNCVSGENFTFTCSNGIIIDVLGSKTYLPANGGGYGLASEVLAETNESLVTVYTPNASSMGVALSCTNATCTTYPSNKELTSSLFTKLYYMNGFGMKHFKLFSEKRDVTGFIIKIWKVDFAD